MTDFFFNQFDYTHYSKFYIYFLQFQKILQEYLCGSSMVAAGKLQPHPAKIGGKKISKGKNLIKKVGFRFCEILI